MGELTSLNEFNSRRHAAWDRMTDNSPRPNSIACPKCGSELLDTCPSITLTSIPPQKNVHCSSCDFVGYRVA